MVTAHARGRGVGRDLLDAAVAGGCEAGLEMLTLNVTAGNVAAIHLYESSGFIRCGNLPRALRVGRMYHDKLQMVLML
jgi:ribosomal protein S18 acetylase RimI-like enzyme